MMQRREFLASAAAAGTGWMLSGNLLAEGSADAAVAPAKNKLVGMYVHQHWPYNHPYAARTWSYEDWHGYLDGLHRLGFNMVQIWPVLETMPKPLTTSDEAHLAKLKRVIDLAHHEFAMKVWIALCPNVSAIDEYAARVPFEKRHFFYADLRVNPADRQAMDAMMERREELLRPLAQADAVSIIDSDPGGYPNSTNREFVDLLLRHRRLLDKLRPGGIELIYWMHFGWPAYCRWYATNEFAPGTKAEFAEVLSLLKEHNPEPWGLATMGRSEYPRNAGVESKVISFNYGTIEGEPSFPMTNFGGDAAYQSGRQMGPRGAMGNAQTHCVQLPNTFAFAQGAKGLPLREQDYVLFADGLVAGRGEAIVAAWRALSGSTSEPMRHAAEQLASLRKTKLETGSLRGLLFGDPSRFVGDLCLMLRAKAALVDFADDARNSRPVAHSFAEFIRRAERWQLTHGYENSWWWPGMDDALIKLNDPSLTAFLRDNNVFPTEKFPGATPFDRVKTAMCQTETYTPRLLQAMKRALWELEAR